MITIAVTLSPIQWNFIRIQEKKGPSQICTTNSRALLLVVGRCTSHYKSIRNINFKFADNVTEGDGIILNETTQSEMRKYYSTAIFIWADEEETSQLNLATRMVERCYSFND